MSSVAAVMRTITMTTIVVTRTTLALLLLVISLAMTLLFLLAMFLVLLPWPRLAYSLMFSLGTMLVLPMTISFVQFVMVTIGELALLDGAALGAAGPHLINAHLQSALLILCLFEQLALASVMLWTTFVLLLAT